MDDDDNMYVTATTPFSGYLRILTNRIIERYSFSRSDIEEKTRAYEANRIPNSTEKQLAARTRTYLINFYGRTMLDWATAVVFFRILGATRIKLSVTLYYDDQKDPRTFSVETGTDDPSLPTNTLPQEFPDENSDPK
jgi:hypothetical protein